MAEHIVSPLSTAMEPGWEAERPLKEDEEKHLQADQEGLGRGA